MRHFDFPDDVLEEIQRDRFKHPTRLVQERMEILWLSVCELLTKIAAHSMGMPLTVVLDNAPYQRCQAVRDMAAALHIELLFLPSYSPNLNLIERLWRFTKKTALNSRHHGSFQEFRQTIDRCLDELPTTHRRTINTLMAPRFQTLENAPLIAA